MIISPKDAILNGWITHPDCKDYQDWVDRKFVSPNAIDFTLDSMNVVLPHSVAIIYEDERIHRMVTPNELTYNATCSKPDDRVTFDWWMLKEQTLYDCESKMYVTVPKNVMCTLVIRSTFARNGIQLNSGIYDDGYVGYVGFTLFNRIGTTFTKPGTRVGQIIFEQAMSEGSYAGHYSHSKDENWRNKSE